MARRYGPRGDMFLADGIKSAGKYVHSSQPPWQLPRLLHKQLKDDLLGCTLHPSLHPPILPLPCFSRLLPTLVMVHFHGTLHSLCSFSLIQSVTQPMLSLRYFTGKMEFHFSLLRVQSRDGWRNITERGGGGEVCI